MKVRTILAATCAALFAVAGFASAHDGQAETVMPKFDQAIPNIPGKSLVVVEVDYAPGAASPPHRHAKSAFIYAYVISGEIEFEGERRRDPHLQSRRELVRTAELEPSNQPQREQDQAGEVAGGLRRRLRRQGANHSSQMRPEGLER